tara:strand:+ start:628 stop:1110 length:483 start_codon:yes stop_codon:yes gene_type:complete
MYLCFHCCQQIEKMLHLPINFDKESQVYEVFGNFCSIECMKSYNAHSNHSNKNIRFSLITQMYDLYTKNINIAPPKESLSYFGGSMSIEEFRKKCGKKSNICLPPFKKNEILVETNDNINNFSWIQNSSIKSEDEENKKMLKRNKTNLNNNSIEHFISLK